MRSIPIPSTAAPISFGKWALLMLLLWPCPALMQTGRAADLEVLPGDSYLATGFVRGRFEPFLKTYTLTNQGSSTLEWRTEQVGDWFSVLEPSGFLAPGTSTNLAVFPNSLSVNLGADVFEGLLTITDVTHGESQFRPVSLKISMPGPGSVETLLSSLTNLMHITFSGPPGEVYVVETSDDFESWTGQSTNLFGADPVTYQIDLSEFEQQYYRTRTISTNAPPSILTLTEAVVEDLVRVRLLGDGGGTYLVETSTNDIDWTRVSTNQLPANGIAILTNNITGGTTGLTYRIAAMGTFSAPPLHHVLITGQSLALGIAGDPALSITPSDVHFRFFSSGSFRSLIHLVEFGFETIASGVGAHLARTHPEHQMLFSNRSAGGAVYEELKKGTEPYAQALEQFREAPHEVAGVLHSYKPSAVFVIHGEGDHINQQYDLNIRQWQEDYERDIGIISGQPGPIPMFHSQASAWTSPGNGSAEFTLGAFMVLEESRRFPDKTVLVGPKYFFDYADGIHLINTSYQWLGEYYARAYREVVVEGGNWTPLQPVSVSRSNNVVTAVFDVPAPPLVIDTNRVSDPGQYGFVYHDGSASPPSILSVEIVESDTLQLTLDSIPSGILPEFLRYAFSAAPGSPGGPMSGPRGNLRDSDDEVSAYGNSLFNWCVHFDESVTVETATP